MPGLVGFQCVGGGSQHLKQQVGTVNAGRGDGTSEPVPPPGRSSRANEGLGAGAKPSAGDGAFASRLVRSELTIVP